MNPKRQYSIRRSGSVTTVLEDVSRGMSFYLPAPTNILSDLKRPTLYAYAHNIEGVASCIAYRRRCITKPTPQLKTQGTERRAQSCRKQVRAYSISRPQFDCCRVVSWPMFRSVMGRCVSQLWTQCISWPTKWMGRRLLHVDRSFHSLKPESWYIIVIMPFR